MAPIPSPTDRATLTLPDRGVAMKKAVGQSPMPQDANVMQSMGPMGDSAIGGNDNPSMALRKMGAGQAMAEAGVRPDDSGDDMEVGADNTNDPPDPKFLKYATEAVAQSRTYMEMSTRAMWTRSYRAFRNEHNSGSKYLSKEWQNRSKIFRPKTRVKVRKGMATAAAALFSTTDVVKIGPGDDADPQQRASAAIKQELINYRLSRQSGQAAVPWFLVSMGAYQDADITGICCSKQSWIHRVRKTGEYEDYEEPLGDAGTASIQGQREKEQVLMDRPDVQLYPPENVLMDPAAPWTSPAQLGAYFILRTPMHVDDIMSMMEDDPYVRTRWIKVSKATLQTHSTSSYDTEGVRRAREGGRDRLKESGSAANGHWNIVWVHENFVRCEGRDYHYWTVGTALFLSHPVPVEDVYPEQGGERPVCLGYGAVESHRIIPMSGVESMQPLQMEANDMANLRLDQVKNVVMPVAKVKRGTEVDTDALKRRSPNSMVYMRDPEKDLVWDRPPDVPASAYNEQNLLNADIDDLTGTFSGSSVATNRDLNETVGGMNLLNGSANAVSEFDLRVWTETWVEPVIAQLVKLEEYYEADATVLALAGKRAQLMEKFGVNEINDDLMQRQVTTTVNVGVGASDPMQRLTKFKAASEIAGGMIGPGVQAGEIKINYKEVCDEVFGAAGYSDAGERFITIMEGDQGQKQDPALEKVKADAQAKQAAQQSEDARGLAQLKMDFQIEVMRIKSAERIEAAKAAAAIEVAKINAKASLASKVATTAMANDHAATQAEQDRTHQTGMAETGHMVDLAKTHMGGSQALAQGAQGHEAAMSQLHVKGEQALTQGEQSGKQQLALGEQKGQQAAASQEKTLQNQLAIAQSKPMPKGHILPRRPATKPVAPALPAPEAAPTEAAGAPDWAVEQTQTMEKIFQELQSMQQRDGLPDENAAPPEETPPQPAPPPPEQLAQAAAPPVPQGPPADGKIAYGPDGTPTGVLSAQGFHPAIRDPKTGEITSLGPPQPPEGMQ